VKPTGRIVRGNREHGLIVFLDNTVEFRTQRPCPLWEAPPALGKEVVESPFTRSVLLPIWVFEDCKVRGCGLELGKRPFA
jgi:hypothetical protein